jgi:hypothetical protein
MCVLWAYHPPWRRCLYVAHGPLWHWLWQDAAEIKSLLLGTSITYLESQAVDVMGFKIWGSPYQP